MSEDCRRHWSPVAACGSWRRICGTFVYHGAATTDQSCSTQSRLSADIAFPVCKGKACKKHTPHKVTQYKKGKDSLAAQGKRRYDRE